MKLRSKASVERERTSKARLPQVAIAAILGLVLALGAGGVAYAASVTSIKSYYTVLGITYYNTATVNNNSIMVAHITVGRNSGTIPAGYSAGQASLYRNGALCSSAAMYYYPNATTGWSGGTAIKNCGRGNYTSRGSTGAYNGSGYNYFYTATSPILTY